MCRFASEYGFQSWPGWEVVAAVSEAEDWSLASAWAGHRQHHPGGNMELVWQIRLNMDLDQVSTSSIFQFQFQFQFHKHMKSINEIMKSINEIIHCCIAIDFCT